MKYQMVVEGVYSTSGRKACQKYDADADHRAGQCSSLLSKERSAAEAVKELMLRDGKTEHSDLP